MRKFVKAIADLQPGTPVEGRSDAVDYTHLLPDKLRNDGYSLHAYDEIDPTGIAGVYMCAGHEASGGKVGALEATLGANPQGEKHIHMESARVDPSHREKGLGMAMYEAMLQHAKDKHKATHVSGGKHSTLAHAVHQKLAAKHGLSYKAERKSGSYPMKDNDLSFDNQYGPYKYTIKHDAELIEALIPDRLEKKLAIPDRYLKKSDLNLQDVTDWSVFEDSFMVRQTYELQKNMAAAGKLLGLSDLDVPLKNARHLWDEGLSPSEAALKAFGVEPTEANLVALSMVADGEVLAKEEGPMMETSFNIQPDKSEGIEMANAVQRAVNAGKINPVKLAGKHSKGSMLAQDPETKVVYLLKPGSGKNSPAKGVNEDTSSQSEREAAFWHVADQIGIGDSYPRADLILVNNHQTAAMELLPVSYRNLGERKKQDPGMPQRILEPYRQNGMIHKWAFIDYVLGNPDRHSQNMMVDPLNRRIRLIDHGSAMAGRSFSPSTDPNSFIPYYLRAWTSRKFTEMDPQERVRMMPGLDRRTEEVFEEWVASIKPKTITKILMDYNINPQPALERLAHINAMPGSKWLVLNKIWAGAV